MMRLLVVIAEQNAKNTIVHFLAGFQGIVNQRPINVCGLVLISLRW